MIKHNELVIDGVRTSSFPFKIIIKESRSFELSESKTQLLEHDGISGAILQSNSHRPSIRKAFTIQMINPSEDELNQSHPTRVRGLKLRFERKVLKLIRSHPTRVRGLKSCKHNQRDTTGRSHPTRVRGLK